jgi:hypothetical protein
VVAFLWKAFRSRFLDIAKKAALMETSVVLKIQEATNDRS